MTRMAFQKCYGVAFHNLVASRWILGIRAMPRIFGVRKDTAKVRNTAWSYWPRLICNELTHVRPSVERMNETGDTTLAIVPAERLDIFAHPELECLSRYRLTMGDQIVPALIARDQLAA